MKKEEAAMNTTAKTEEKKESKKYALYFALIMVVAFSASYLLAPRGGFFFWIALILGVLMLLAVLCTFIPETPPQLECSKCQDRLLSSEGLEAKPSSVAIFGGGEDLFEAMGKKFSMAVECKKCNALYCAGCCLEVWKEGGPTRFICPTCHADLGDASMLV